MADQTAETDLLGDPIPEIPSITAPLPWRVFAMNDCDWWLARTLEEAKETYLHDVIDDNDYVERAREVSEEEMDRLKYVDNIEQPKSQWVRRTFREELTRRVSAGISKPGLFASTEY